MRHTEGSVQHAWVLGGRYRVIDRLGQGGMADVFRAHDELLDRDVAVKVFRTTPQAGEADIQAELRRELELQTLARLSHPNLTTLFDGSVTGDGPGYLVLELVDGPNLAARLREGPLPEPLARLVCAQIAEALAYVHAHGMVHRDVKPANILLGIDGRPDSVRARLSDFGIVRMVGSERVTSADLTLGTASYIAPEQARGGNVEPAADIYSLGLVMIEALTGVRCFDGPLHEALAARLTSSPMIPTTLPHPWPTLLAAMTASDPAQRPSAEEVAATLRADSVTGLLTPPPPAMPAPVPMQESTPPPVVRPPVAHDDEYWYPEEERRRRGSALLLTVLALTAIVAGGAYFLVSGNAEPAKNTPTVSTSVHQSAAPAKKHHHASSTTAAHVVEHKIAPSHKAHKATATHTAAATQPTTHATASDTPTPSPSSSPATSSPPPTSPPPSTSTPPATPAATGVAAP